MEQKPLSKIMVSICVLVVIGFGCWTAINVDAFLKAREQWNAQSHQLRKINLEVAEIQRLMEFYRKEKAEFQKYLFQEKDIPSFLDGLSSFAQKAGINIVDMKTGQFQEVNVPKEILEGQSVLGKKKLEKKTQNDDSEATVQPTTKEDMSKMLTLATLPINIKINGPYESIVNFYRHLEGFKQLISIGNIDIASVNAEYPSLQCNFTVKIYSLKTLEELQNSRRQ